MVVKVQSASTIAVWASTMTVAQMFIYLENICRKSIYRRLSKRVNWIRWLTV